MDKFESANASFGTELAWSEDSERVAEGKATFFGSIITGVFLDKKLVNTNAGENWSYKVHLFKDAKDPEIQKGKKPDGEVVSFWGSKIINDAFEGGYRDGAIPRGAVVRLVYEGLKKGKTGYAKTKGYHAHTVTCFVPSQQFEGVGSNDDDSSEDEAAEEKRPVATVRKASKEEAAPAARRERRVEEPSSEETKFSAENEENLELDELDM